MAHQRRLALLFALFVLGACAPKPRPVSLKVEPLDSPAPAGALVPELSRLRDGALVLSWLERRNGGGYSFRMAMGRAGLWSEPRTIVSHEDLLMFSASLPAVAEIPGGGLLAYWETKDRSGKDPFSERVTFSISKDEGATWSLPGVPHRDDVPGQHAFVSAFPVGDRLGLVWLDARRQTYVPPAAGKGKEDGEWLGSIGLLSTTIGADGALGPEAVVDPVTCECCPTAAAVSGRGPVVAYRDRSDPPSDSGPLRFDQDVVRDIHLVRWQGGKWTAPKRVHADNWVFNGCPDNGPAVAARGDLVAVAWWTAPEGKGAVKVAFSNDAGDSFGPPVRVDEGFGQGQVTVALAKDGALVGWLESGRTQARYVDRDGRPGPVTTLGPAAHHARLPRWPADGSGFISAWSEGGEDDVKHVRLARVSLD